MMEMIIIVQVFPKKTIYLHSARPVVALWQRAVHRLPYPRLAGEKVVGCIGPVSYTHLTLPTKLEV